MVDSEAQPSPQCRTLVFVARHDESGIWVANCRSPVIFADAPTLAALFDAVNRAVRLYARQHPGAPANFATTLRVCPATP